MAFLSFVRNNTDRTIGGMTPEEAFRLPAEFSRYTADASGVRNDLGRIIRMDSASPMTVTLNVSPANFGASRFYVGETLVFTQWNTGAVTFAAGAGASLVSFDSLVAIEGRYAIAFAMYTEGDVWWLSGRLA